MKRNIKGMEQAWIKYRYGIHWNKPMLNLRVARNLIAGKIYSLLGIKRFILRGIMFQITYNCNYNCKYCLCKKLIEPGRKEMSVEDFKRVVKQAKKLGCTGFGFEGGEPFIRRDWEEVLKALEPWKNHVFITTNSTMLTEDVIKKLVDYKVDTVNLSLDSGDPTVHDSLRRPGSYDQVITALKLCKKHGLKPILNTVLSKWNMYDEGFDKLMKLAEENDVFVNVLVVKGTGNFREQQDSMLNEKDFDYFYNVLRKKYPRILTHLDYNYGKWGCPGVKEMLNITPYGDVFSCANGHISGGNLQEEDLKTIRDRMLKKDYFNTYQPCMLTENKEFMDVFYTLMKDRLTPLSLEEFDEAWKKKTS